jgi:transcriptional regulator with XRE-family HTH domain
MADKRPAVVLHSEQIKAARGLLGWSQAELANRAGVGQMTIKRAEARPGLLGGTVDIAMSIRIAFEKAGIVFIDADDVAGVGVRLGKRRSAPRP